MTDTWGRCTKDECYYQDEEGYCLCLLGCIHEIGEQTQGDREYPGRVDEGEIR